MVDGRCLVRCLHPRLVAAVEVVHAHEHPRNPRCFDDVIIVYAATVSTVDSGAVPARELGDPPGSEAPERAGVQSG